MDDLFSIGGSTLSGAAMGSSVLPGVGTVIGGAIGFFSGLFGASAKNESERLAQLQIEREKIAAGMEGEARKLTMALNKMAVDRQRKAFSQQAMLSTENVRAGEAITGLIGSSISKSARASLLHQQASALQFSYKTERMGELISDKLQEALDTKAGHNDPKKAVPTVSAPGASQSMQEAAQALNQEKHGTPSYDYVVTEDHKGNPVYKPAPVTQSDKPDRWQK